jgi:hypothetical protein
MTLQELFWSVSLSTRDVTAFFTAALVLLALFSPRCVQLDKGRIVVEHVFNSGEHQNGWYALLVMLILSATGSISSCVFWAIQRCRSRAPSEFSIKAVSVLALCTHFMLVGATVISWLSPCPSLEWIKRHDAIWLLLIATLIHGMHAATSFYQLWMMTRGLKV